MKVYTKPIPVGSEDDRYCHPSEVIQFRIFDYEGSEEFGTELGIDGISPDGKYTEACMVVSNSNRLNALEAAIEALPEFAADANTGMGIHVWIDPALITAIGDENGERR